MSVLNEYEITVDNTEKVESGIDAAIARALEKIGLKVERYAMGLCPVDTGRLRNSITHSVEKGQNCVYIGTNVEYAPYVELGTSHHKEQPFLRPAAIDHAGEYRTIIEKELKK